MQAVGRIGSGGGSVDACGPHRAPLNELVSWPTMLQKDRQHALTAGLFRVLKAAGELGRECLSSIASLSERVLFMGAAYLNVMPTLGWQRPVRECMRITWMDNICGG